MKIERLLGLAERARALRTLEIGTGSGGIGQYFGIHPGLACQVSAVDVHDNRVTTGGFDFCKVKGVELPFADRDFDVVISNHVI